MTNPPVSVESSPESQREAIDHLKVLVASAGWKLYCSIVESQTQVRITKLIATPLDRMDAVLEQEYTKGEIAAMRVALRLPETMIDTFLHELTKPTAEGNEDETA